MSPAINNTAPITSTLASTNVTLITKQLVNSTLQAITNPNQSVSKNTSTTALSTPATIVNIANNPNINHTIFSPNSTSGHNISATTLAAVTRAASVLNTTISAILSPKISTSTTATTSISTTTSPPISTTISSLNHTFINDTLKGEPLYSPNEESPGGLVIAFITLISIAISVILILAILMLRRKNRLDRLRHHLMPVYNFDPAEDGEDWETELLDEPFGSSQNSYSGDGAIKPSIKLDSGIAGGLNVKPGSGSIVKNKPTPSSGLLSSDNNNQTQRFLYTNDRPVV